MKRALLLCLFVVGCSAPPMEPVDAGVEVPDAGEVDAGEVDAGVVDAGTKADGCAEEAEFGALFTNAFGRADGTVVAVVPPAWPGCAFPNSDHVVIQVSIDGGVQRLVVNVKSDFGAPEIFMRELNAPLPAPAYGEGWHPGLQLDYPGDFDVHTDGGWDEVNLEQASARIYDAITVGAPLSVYATSSGGTYAASAHKIHRNNSRKDGAIVIDPTGPSPRWLLFRFANQTF